MLAVDTNVLVRFLVDDDAEQSAKAKRLMENEDLFVASTVFLEAEWVLRRVYGLKRPAIIASFRMLAGLPRVTVEDPAALANALDWMEAGMDFADALRLLKLQGCDAFASFDRKLAKAAESVGAIKVVVP